MKILLLVCLPVLLCSMASAQQTLSYPVKDPLITFKAPEDWKAKEKNGSLFVLSPDGEDVIVEIMSMEAGLNDDEAAMKEAKATVDDFKNLVFEDGGVSEGNGLKMNSVNGTGSDKNGAAVINLMILKNPAAKNPILLSIISTPDGNKKYQKDIFTIALSASAAGSAKGKSAAAGPVQTYSYPDKAKPDFAIDFPADWKMEADAEGAYVESPDKLVALNVIMIDMSDVDVAIESMKKKVAAKYESIVWNDGQDPHVVKDEAAGVTATFNNGAAEDKAGHKYSVNFAQYTRKDGKKFLLLLGQEPLAALEKHGDALEKILQSIKVR